MDAHTRAVADAVVNLSVGHGGDALGAIRYIIDAHPGEPLFVLRGRDALTVPVIHEYVNLCNKFCLHSHRDHGGLWLPGQAERAVEHGDRFINWQRANAKLTHLPDPLPPTNDPTIPGTTAGE